MNANAESNIGRNDTHDEARFSLQFRRNRINITSVVTVILAVTAGVVAPWETFGQTNAYIVMEWPGDDASQVKCKLNNVGDIAGRTDGDVKGGPRATIWKRSRSKKHIGALSGGDYSSASDINDSGEVTGVSNTGKGIVPFFWTATGKLRRVPLLPGDSCGQAIGINKYGHVAGYSSGANGARAFLWTRKLGAHDLGVLNGGNYSRARDLNDSDEVVGMSASSAGERAVLWTKTGNVRDLGTLPGDTSSEASAINNNGDVVGYSKGPRGMRAFLWTQATGMQDLGVLPGGNSSRALDLNDDGDVVGSSTSSSGDRAFVWTSQGGIVDLNSASSADLGVVFIEAHAINAKGEILVMGKITHEPGMSGKTGSGDAKYCATGAPSSFLLVPASQ
jgi:probable HAF family extracellular repeat protein